MEDLIFGIKGKEAKLELINYGTLRNLICYKFSQGVFYFFLSDFISYDKITACQ